MRANKIPVNETELGETRNLVTLAIALPYMWALHMGD